MLPFLKRKQLAVGGVSTEYRKPDAAPAGEAEEEGGDEALESCASDLIRGVHENDMKLVAAAMQAAFDIMESRPHEEGEHEEEESEGEEE